MSFGLLAGGLSSRWGGFPKATAHLFGVPMALAITCRISSVPLLGICIRPEQTSWAKQLSLPIITEHSDFPEGPLKGIHCLLEALPVGTEWLLIAPCDMPWIPNNIDQTLYWQALQHQTNIVVLGYPNNNHTLAMLIHRSETQHLAQYLANGNQRVRTWLQHRNAHIYHWPYSHKQLSNMNCPENMS